MEDYSGVPKYVSVLEFNNHSIHLGYAHNVSELLVILLAQLECNAEGACGYIADVETGRVLQRHRKVAAG